MNASKKRSLILATVIVAVCAFAVATVPVIAVAQETCPDGDGWTKVNTTGEPMSITITAPEGKLVDDVCIKRATIVEYFYDQMVEIFTKSYTDHAISHYSYTLADKPPEPEECESGEIASAVFNFSATGWAGWSCPRGQTIVSGRVIPSSFSTNFSGPAAPGEPMYPSYPHYTYTPPEEGWVVQAGGTAGQAQICMVCAEAPPVCEDEEAYNYGEPLPCVYDVCPNLEGLQEEVPEGYVKPGRRCIPKPEPLHDYWLKVWYEVDCKGVEYYFAVMDFQTMLLGPFSLKTHTWTDPFTLEVAPAVTNIGYNPGEPYGTLFADDVPPINEPEQCYEEPEEDYLINVDCDGWEVVYISGEVRVVVDSGKWKDKGTLEAVSVEIPQMKITVDVLEPRDCYECDKKSLFYWTDGWCMIRQREGPIGGQTRPFIPMIYGYCGCDYEWGEWEGVWIRVCEGKETAEYEYWDELPQGCGWRNCGNAEQ